MKIRDIKNFRFFYKTVVRNEPNKDENFIGSTIHLGNKRCFGFFDIYHGDKAEKEGIEGFLRGFLDMAQDSQAIYEFLQNAVDANSTTFEMYYDDEYFLAFNNGFQFDFEGIRSILNVGVSTKSQDSSNIGKFGIGFKLIHRLVGEKSGLEELKNLSGPILFSWGNEEDLNELKNFTQSNNIDYEQDEYFHIKYSKGKFGNHKNLPWLFKILLTNFPCQPDETIKDLKYQETANAFTKEEVAELARWANNKIKVDTSKHSLNSGSLFFLRLGKDKGNKLSNKKIEDGIQFSLSILNQVAYYQKKLGISQIRINENVFEAKRLFFERFVIKFGSEEYDQIKPQRRNEDDTSDIEILVGFMDYKFALREIKGNPNFYLFFPLSEEVHNLTFIIHSTGFYNASQRTNLQGNESKNTETQGINEVLLKVITGKIQQKLLTYHRDTAQDEKFRYRFLNIYSNLLLSNKATENHKNWVDSCLIEPIFDILKLQVPTQNGYSDKPVNVKIKNTSLNVSPAELGCPEIEWFAWQEKYDKTLIDEVRKPEKLHLEKWGIVDLLKYAIQHDQINKINAWVQKIEIETARIFAEEKQQKEVNPSMELPKTHKPYFTLLYEINDNTLKSNIEIIAQIKLFKFSDGNYYSLNELFVNSNLIFRDVTLSSIWSILNYKLDFVISQIDISKYKNLYIVYQEKINNLALFQKIALKTKIAAQAEEKEKRLFPDDKKKLFLVLLELSKDNEGKVDTKRIRDIEMFADTQKRIMPLRKLIKGDSQIPNWLFAFKMNQYEDMTDLSEYCAKQDEIYKNIVIENWENIVSYEKLNATYFYLELLKYYKDSKDKELLESKKLPFVATQNGFKSVDEVFFHAGLSDWEILKYLPLQELVIKVFKKELPKYNILSYLVSKDSPLRITINHSISSFLNNTENLEYYEVDALLTLAITTKEKIFEQIYIEKISKKFSIVKHTKSVVQYFSDKTEINQLLSNQPNFKLLPKEFSASEFSILGLHQGKELYMTLLRNLNFSEHLLPIVRESDIEVQLAFLDKLENFELQIGKTYDKTSFEHRCLKLAIACYEINFATQFAPKILINGKLRLNDIAVKDDIKFDDLSLSLASVLPEYKGVSDIITKIIKQFSDFSKDELSDNVFPFSNKKKEEILSELYVKFPVLKNIEQFAFLLYYSKQLGKNLLTTQSLKELPIPELLQFAYKKNFTELSSYINLGLGNKVYPSELALETEMLPRWALLWIEDKETDKKLKFLSQLGVHISNSTITDLRRYFIQNFKFDQNRIAIDNNLSGGQLLLNTLHFLKEKNVELKSQDQYAVFREIVRVLNTYLPKVKQLKIKDIFNTELIFKSSKESEWKTETFKIHLFEGKFPRLVTVHEIENFVYYKYDEGDYYVNGNDIYINNCIDHKKILEKVVSDDTNNFKFEDLWKIYNPAESKKENPFLDLSKEDEDFIRSIIKGDFELSEKLDANTTAKIKTLLAIKLQYPFTEISDNGRFLKAGEDHVIVRSAQNGLLYLDLYHWERLNEANVRLSVYTKNQVQIFDSQDQLIQFTKPQNKSGILRMPNDYDLDDYNALSNITDKGKWHFVFIVNENTKAAMKYNEVMNLDDYNY